MRAHLDFGAFSSTLYVPQPPQAIKMIGPYDEATEPRPYLQGLRPSCPRILLAVNSFGVPAAGRRRYLAGVSEMPMLQPDATCRTTNGLVS
jgi:hypothetical protein